MIEEILEPENLAQAWKRVKANKGAPGIDGMTVEDFPAFARKEWPRIAKAIVEGSYRPAPVKRVWIPKPDGTQRPLGIPTVLDRVIQQAVAQMLGPLFEVGFSEHSYGYRPGRSAHQAVAEMEAGWTEGRRHAVECDLKSFFDTVNHDRLMNALKEKCGCRRTLGLIGRYLRAGVVLPDGTFEATPLGVPQGGPLSPLLANIALDPLDKELEARGGAGAGGIDPLLRRTAATGGQPRQKPRRTPEVLRVPRLQAEQAGQAGVDGEGAAPLQGAGEGNYQPQPRAPGSDRHRRAEPLRPRLAQLLQV
jgi:RNA-directed DNA polymerase